MKAWIDTNTGKRVQVGDIIEMDFRTLSIIKRIKVRVADIENFGVQLVDLEGARHAGYDEETTESFQRVFRGWNWDHLTSVRLVTVPDSDIPGDYMRLTSGEWVHESLSVITLNGSRILKSDAVEVTLDEETNYYPKTMTVEIDGENHLKSNCFRLVYNYYDRRSGGEWVTEQPEDGYTYMENYDCWADDDIVAYCYGTNEAYFIDEMEEWCGDWYCRDWLNDETFICDCCGERFSNDDYAEDGNCTNCWSPPSGLQSYSDKSAANLRPEKNVPLKFGIELEVEGRDADNGVELCESIFPDQYVVYKEDGSLNDGGFEIVTRPDAPEVHKRIFSEFLSDPRVRRNLTSWNSGNCGVHIHVSRKPLSALWIGRILVMINSPSMRSIVAKVSGRYNTNYAEIRTKKLTNGKKTGVERKYDAVNNSPRETIEFRLFRGTLIRESFIRYIEFVEAVLAFTSPATTSNRDVAEPEKFLDFVSKRRKDYKELFAFLKKKDFYTK
jgi:uncharacterized CHY-type Zn-finger protein